MIFGHGLLPSVNNTITLVFSCDTSCLAPKKSSLTGRQTLEWMLLCREEDFFSLCVSDTLSPGTQSQALSLFFSSALLMLTSQLVSPMPPICDPQLFLTPAPYFPSYYFKLLNSSLLPFSLPCALLILHFTLLKTCTKMVNQIIITK